MIILNLINGLPDLEMNPTGEKIIIKDYDINTDIQDCIPPDVKKDEHGRYYIEYVF